MPCYYAQSINCLKIGGNLKNADFSKWGDRCMNFMSDLVMKEALRLFL